MSDLVEKVALALAIVLVERKRGTKVVIPPEDVARAKATAVAEVGDEARAAILAVVDFLCLEASRSASPAQAHEYLSATLLKKQLERLRGDK